MSTTKTILKGLAAFCLAVSLVACGNTNQDKTIYVETPARPAGQESVIGLTAPALDTVRVGIIGLGMRGTGAVDRWIHVPFSKIVAVCDVEPDRTEHAVSMLEKAGIHGVASYSGSDEAWKQLCENDNVDLVYVCTDWVHHAMIGVYAMEHGKHVAIEVPAAQSLEEIWSLINTSEKTRKHCMQLENCVYDFFEMNTLNMAQHGVFGEVLHVEGSYHHCLDEYWNAYWHGWRMDFNRTHRGDIYPTHGLGPVCQVLNIHRGDRMKTLVAMDTKAVNGPAFIKNTTGEEVTDFQNGDETMTMIRTEKGKTILIEHDVMTPRPYSRMYQVVGTKGYASKYPVEQYCLQPAEGVELPEELDNLDSHSALPEDAMNALVEQYTHPIISEIGEVAKEVGGHGGMDFIMDYRLAYCLHYGLPLDMDVYDLAEWCCLGELGSISIANGNAPVAVPDFTRGEWDKLDGYKHAFVK